MLLLSYFLYLLYTVNQFSFTHFRYCVSTFSYKHMPQCKFSLYLKKAGLASRNIVHFLKKVILRCIGLCFNYHHLYLLTRLDQTFDPTYTCRIIVHGCLLGHYSSPEPPGSLNRWRLGTITRVALQFGLPVCNRGHNCNGSITLSVFTFSSPEPPALVPSLRQLRGPGGSGDKNEFFIGSLSIFCCFPV